MSKRLLTTFVGEQRGGNAFEFVRVNTDIPNRAPFTWQVAQSIFAGTPEPVLTIGYNQTPSGTLIRPGEPGLAWNMEADYNDGSGANKMEVYLQYISADAATIKRPLFMQINRSTNMVSGLQINADRTNFQKDDGSTSLAAIFSNRFVVFSADGANDSSVNVKAGSGRNSFLGLGQNGNDDVFRIATTGPNTSRFVLNGRDIAYMYSNPGGGPGASIAVGGVDDTSGIGVFAVTNSPSNRMALVARAKSNQNASIFEMQDASSNPLSRFDKSGFFMTRKVTEPANADLVNGEVALWWDPRPGLTKLMIKGKSTLGTVVTGSVALK
jgi:hypothetical protein